MSISAFKSHILAENCQTELQHDTLVLDRNEVANSQEAVVLQLQSFKRG